MQNEFIHTPPAYWLGPHPGLRPPLTMAALESASNWQAGQVPSAQNVLVFSPDPGHGLGQMMVMPGWFRWQLLEICEPKGCATIARTSRACAEANLRQRLPLQ